MGEKDISSSVAVVMPAFNAAKTLQATFEDLPIQFREKVILVDDFSSDDTVDVARKLGLKVIERKTNGGYGANQKVCYAAALDSGAEIIIMLHPDNQYDARVTPIMADLISLQICDVILGNRIRTRNEALDGGMPLWKYIINRLSTFGENFILGQSIGDFHSGLRAYSADVLRKIPFQENSDDFAFDQEMLVGDIPVPVRYFDEASSINFTRSLKYGIGGINAIFCRFLHVAKLRYDSRYVQKSDSHGE
jgi:glycosyltransferase involved in cell wall biosynthesis